MDSFSNSRTWVKIGVFCSSEGVPSPKMEVSSPKMEVRGKNRSFVFPNRLLVTSKSLLLLQINGFYFRFILFSTNWPFLPKNPLF